MKKSRMECALLVFTSIMVLTLGFSGQVYSYSEKDPLVLKASIDNPPGDMKAKTIKHFGDIVEKKTNGRIKFEYFYGGSLTKKPQYVDAVAKGIADISTGPVSFVTGKLPELSIFEVYGAYKLDKHLEMEKAVEPLMTEYFKTKGIHHVLIQYSGSVVFPHKTKFLATPEDWKGQKIRLGGRWQSELGKKWGASPVFLSPGELYIALQKGVIDGYMLIWDIINGLKLYEVAPFHADTNFSNNVENVTMNLKKWETMTKEDQAIFTAAVNETKPWTFKETVKYYEEVKKGIIEKGGKIHELTAQERSNYLKDAYSLYPEVEKVAGPTGKKFMDILEQFRDK
ncbi:MAG: TRAP transporter substrate-binding protein [Desulfobacteraceae bacterium]|nr:MAG: TRAP transporter substrate-binding protein [Desulfobacteraceae bacterium]